MTAAQRPLRLVIAAWAIVAVGLVQVAEILLILGPQPGMDPCSLDVFGARFPPNGDGCYIPVGIPAIVAAGTFGLAALIGLGRFELAPMTGLAAGTIGLVMGGSLPAQDGLVTTTAIQVGFLGAVAFLVHTPAGPRAGARARRAWEIALVSCSALVIVDTAFSGFMRTSEAGPQGAFAVVGLIVLVAGVWSGRLAAREPRGAAIPAPVDTSAA